MPPGDGQGGTKHLRTAPTHTAGRKNSVMQFPVCACYVFSDIFRGSCNLLSSFSFPHRGGLCCSPCGSVSFVRNRFRFLSPASSPLVGRVVVTNRSPRGKETDAPVGAPAGVMVEVCLPSSRARQTASGVLPGRGTRIITLKSRQWKTRLHHTLCVRQCASRPPAHGTPGTMLRLGLGLG